MPAIASARLRGKAGMNESDDTYMLLLNAHFGKYATDYASADLIEHASIMVVIYLI